MISQWPDVVDEASVEKFISRNIAAGGTYVRTSISSPIYF